MATVPPITGTGTSSVSSALDNVEIASNFTMFLQLLTTQLKNQNHSIRSTPINSPSSSCSSRKSSSK